MTTLDQDASSAPLDEPALGERSRIERGAFWLCALAATSLMWIASRPPLIDLPAHGAQIGLWRDLLLGHSPWSSLVFINLLTPYLIGYGAALPLSFFMSPERAIAVVLSVAYLCFVGACVLLRRELRSDERLDWLFLPSFFGFAWSWGFYTFLTAAPVLLAFLWSVLRWRAAPSRGRAAALIALGLALLFSHGLLFLFGLGTAGLLLIGPWREPLPTRARRLAPLVLLGLGLILFAWITSERGTATQVSSIEFGTPIWLRPFAALAFVVSDNWDPKPILACLAALALATPFVIGDRLNRGPAVTLFAALTATFLLVPAFAFETGYLFARFALFLPPFAVLLFRMDPSREAQSGDRAARLTMAVACLAILVAKGWSLRKFSAEATSYARIERAAAPGKRALAVIFDRGSVAAGAARAYSYFPDWYQADRGGFVDYNFAELPPQVVRFRPGAASAVSLPFIADPNGFAWGKNKGWVYDYFFFRGAADPIGWLKARSPCAFERVASEGTWALVRRVSCPASGRASDATATKS